MLILIAIKLPLDDECLQNCAFRIRQLSLLPNVSTQVVEGLRDRLAIRSVQPLVEG